MNKIPKSASASGPAADTSLSRPLAIIQVGAIIHPKQRIRPFTQRLGNLHKRLKVRFPLPKYIIRKAPFVQTAASCRFGN